jgi:heme/copper-type cytochrome/quinol oxidase subunit 1
MWMRVSGLSGAPRKTAEHEQIGDIPVTQEQINLVLGILGIFGSSSVILYIVQQFFMKRKNKIDYGDDLLDTMNKTAASIKQAREDLTKLEAERRVSEQQHEQEIADLEKLWKERQDRMKARIVELEKTIVKYDISFTLITNPQVQVTDLKVIGKEDVMASQRMRAVARNSSSGDAKPKE